jgi:hypothetical protein
MNVKIPVFISPYYIPGFSNLQPHLNPPSNFSHKGTQRKKEYPNHQRKKEYPNHTNEKLLEVQKPFLEKVFGRRRQKLTVDLGAQNQLPFTPIFDIIDSQKITGFTGITI